MNISTPQQAPGPILSDESIVKVLASFGIDATKSKYGFPELQVSTNIPGIRNVIKAYLAAPVGEVVAAPTDERLNDLLLERRKAIVAMNPDVQKDIEAKIIAHVVVRACRSEGGEVVAATGLVKLRAAFRTTVSSGGGTDPREYAMVFRFKTMQDMHDADDEWRLFAALPPQAPATGDAK